MITTIDKAGRIVVPKPIRDAMGLTAGSKVDISYSGGRIEIEYAPSNIVMVPGSETEDGFPVLKWVGEGEPPVVTADEVRRIRDEIYEERELRAWGY